MPTAKTKLILFIFTYVFGLRVNAQTFQWAKNFGGAGTGSSNSIAVDASGNVYTVGNFDGTNDFDPGAGITNLTGTSDIFVSKLTASGAYSWARAFASSPSNDWGMDIALDATGNVYVTGAFSNTVDFDPGVGVFNLTSAGEYDVFVCKLSNAGNFLWAKRFGGPAADWGQSIAVDASGNIYVTGEFEGTTDFDPNGTVYNMTATGTVYDIFVNKLTTAGNFVWARKMGGTGSDLGLCSSLDASGNIYVSGAFESTCDFDPGAPIFNLTSAGFTDIFIAKLNSAGTFLWARRMGGTQYEQAYSIAIDASGNVLTTGYFMGTCDFDPGAAAVNLVASGSTQDIFISKLNSSGNYVWAKHIGGTATDVAYSLDVDAAGNVYTTGYYAGTVDFNPGTGTTNFTSTGADFFINKLNASGNHVWTVSIGGTGFDRSNAIKVDASNSIYTSGFFNAIVDFNPASGSANLTATASDIFVFKLSQSSPLPVQLLFFDATSVEENRVQCKWQTASELDNDYFTIEKSKDGNEFEEIGKVNSAGNSTTILNYSFIDEQPYPHTSFYRLKQTDFNGEFSYSKIIAVRFDKNAGRFSVYYNTSDRNYLVKFFAQEPVIYQILISDLTGRVVRSENFSAHKGSNTLNVHTTSLAKGVYILGVQSSLAECLATKIVVD